jgi:hypothetical protein
MIDTLLDTVKYCIKIALCLAKYRFMDAYSLQMMLWDDVAMD